MVFDITSDFNQNIRIGANAYCQYESENMIVFSHGGGLGSNPRGPSMNIGSAIFSTGYPRR